MIHSANLVTLTYAMGTLERLTPETPIAEPVTEQEVRDQLRVDPNIGADYLMRLARVARHAVERYLNRSLVKQDLAVSCAIRRPVLPLPLSHPFVAILEVLYKTPEGESAPVLPLYYMLDLSSVPISIDLTAAPASTFYTVKYRAGSDLETPEDIRHAILALARWAFDQPAGARPEGRYPAQLAAGSMPPMIAMLLDPYRMEVHSW